MRSILVRQFQCMSFFFRSIGFLYPMLTFHVYSSAGMYMQEALELVCRKRKIANPNDYALVIQEGVIKLLIPLDRTVASLQGKRELTLMKKAMLPQLGMEITKLTGKTTDPNGALLFFRCEGCFLLIVLVASIFKRMSDAPENIVSAMLDLSTAYRKYTVYRKLPMLVTRQERMLAIDGAYIHVCALSFFPFSHL